MTELTYSYVTEHCEWLEDAYRGRFARFDVGNEESVWVDHDNECIVDDPDETIGEEHDERAREYECD